MRLCQALTPIQWRPSKSKLPDSCHGPPDSRANPFPAPDLPANPWARPPATRAIESGCADPCALGRPVGARVGVLTRWEGTEGHRGGSPWEGPMP
ncbi:hypothetical protein D187_008028 [Cystobacter fuscus DSM 2262]|uniref:Uncharacterized protein n=1 Tax=Cystobacter fuscus (strain ATCC 25194 / DSM 2262 / NBRC 100088 / M29) TaxID=1242864 RepID=S9P0R5_CYSF2|nr:hypothetical protein D187_008028 [Cystobacter fuscus DSM 2262]